MKQNLYLFLSLLFVALSVWLSHSVKQSRQQLADAERNLVLLNREAGQLKFSIDMLQEAFDLNFNRPPVSLASELPAINARVYPVPVLHLKQNACSPCNMGVIRMLVDQMREKEGFRIISHPSNRHFLSGVLEEASAQEESLVIWLSSRLYEKDNGYDAELLFIDSQNRKLGCLPLELLKEKSLFEKMLAAS